MSLLAQIYADNKADLTQKLVAAKSEEEAVKNTYTQALNFYQQNQSSPWMFNAMTWQQLWLQKAQAVKEVEKELKREDVRHELRTGDSLAKYGVKDQGYYGPGPEAQYRDKNWNASLYLHAQAAIAGQDSWNARAQEFYNYNNGAGIELSDTAKDILRRDYWGGL